jgi:hypothetical protein
LGGVVVITQPVAVVHEIVAHGKQVVFVQLPVDAGKKRIGAPAFVKRTELRQLGYAVLAPGNLQVPVQGSLRYVEAPFVGRTVNLGNLERPGIGLMIPDHEKMRFVFYDRAT